MPSMLRTQSLKSKQWWALWSHSTTLASGLKRKTIRAAAQVELERRVIERTAQLQKAHDRMRRLSAHLTTVREEERTRIAREMHDDLGAKLTAFDLELKALSYRCANDEKLTLRIESMLDLAQGAMDSLRRILSDLRPGVLDHPWALGCG